MIFCFLNNTEVVKYGRIYVVNIFSDVPCLCCEASLCAGIVRRSLGWRAELMLALRAAAAPSVSQSVVAVRESGQPSTPSAEPLPRCGCEPTGVERRSSGRPKRRDIRGYADTCFGGFSPESDQESRLASIFMEGMRKVGDAAAAAAAWLSLASLSNLAEELTAGLARSLKTHTPPPHSHNISQSLVVSRNISNFPPVFLP